MTDQRQVGGPSRNRNKTEPQQQARTATVDSKPLPQQDMPPPAGAGDQAPALYQLPPQAKARGISEEQWFTLRNSLYPGALPESCVMVWDYCKARKLDPMKKPCHIVPMEVEVKKRDPQTREVTKHKEWRDVVMPGIYEYRTTAMRTGLYLGHSEPEYGDDIESFGVTAPYWCSMTMYRWNEKATRVTEFPVKVFFEEICGTKWGTQKGELVANRKWSQSPIQMLTKCTEAAGLREAFPDELGGEHTIEEMEGRVISDGDDSVVLNVPPGQSRNDTAKEALRARQGQQSAQQPRQEAQRQPEQQRTAQTQPTQQQARAAADATSEATAAPAEDEEIPWESKQGSSTQQQKPSQPKTPQTDEEWAQAMKDGAKKSRADLDAIWDAHLAACDAAGKEVSVDIEAVYQLLAGK
jgi:phage recombination protein Bet